MVKSTKGGGPSGRAAAGRRGLTVKLRTAKGRKIASTRWLQRQLNDPYVTEAKRQGYRSRAAFKLIEIDDKNHLLKPGMVAEVNVMTGKKTILHYLLKPITRARERALRER